MWLRDIGGREGLQGTEATRSKDNRDGEGKKSSQEMEAREAGGGGVTEGRRKRLIQAALALDRVLLPGSNKTFFCFLKK